MDQVHIVRHKVLVEGRSQRAVARELGLARVTVRKYLDQAVPLRIVEAAPRPRPVWDAVAERVQAVLVDSVRWTGGKQRLTATRLHELLVAEGHRVADLVKDRSPVETAAPRGLRAAAYGRAIWRSRLLEVWSTRRDRGRSGFTEAADVLGRDFAGLRRKDQIAFRRARQRLAHFEGVPAASRIHLGGRGSGSWWRSAHVTTRFAAMARIMLEAVSVPGRGYDKARGVRGKAVGSRQLVRVTRPTLAPSCNVRRNGCAVAPNGCGRPDPRERSRRQRHSARPAAFPQEATSSPRLAARVGRMRARNTRCRVAGRVNLICTAATVTIVAARDGIQSRHASGSGRSITAYLSELARKPQAVRQVLPDLLRDLGGPFPAIWDQLHLAHGPRDAARLFAKVLGQLDTYGAAVVVPALTVALATGTPLLLALTPVRSALARVALDAVPASLRGIDVGSGCAADYDGWLVEVGA